MTMLTSDLRRVIYDRDAEAPGPDLAVHYQEDTPHAGLSIYDENSESLLFHVGVDYYNGTLQLVVFDTEQGDEPVATVPLSDAKTLNELTKS